MNRPSKSDFSAVVMDASIDSAHCPVGPQQAVNSSAAAKNSFARQLLPGFVLAVGRFFMISSLVYLLMLLPRPSAVSFI